MLSQHKSEFDNFRPIHDAYMLNSSKHQEEFNERGKKIMDIVKDWEDKLCRRSEGNGYAAFTEKLAEKFMGEVRKEFPMIDRVGLVMKKMKPLDSARSKPATPAFALNKINLENNFDLNKINI